MKRPTFLTVWLILMAVSDLFSLYSYTFGSSNITSTLPNFPLWTLPIYIVLIVVQLISVVLLWQWKKVGFYLVVASAIIAAVLNVITLGAIGIGAIIIGLVGIGILYLAMRPAWQQFQ